MCNRIKFGEVMWMTKHYNELVGKYYLGDL